MQIMKSILKQVLIVVVGIFTSIAIFLAIGLLLWQPSKPNMTDKTVLHIALRGEVSEHVPDTLRKFFQGEQEKVIDLIALKNIISYAQEDKKIQGIYLEIDALKVGWASLEEIRNALLAFQQTGKFIVAYGEHYTQKTYYLASLADDIVLHPESIFPLKGLSQTVFFYKALLDQLEVAPQVFHVGKYKSAIEPFTRQDMSQESKYQSSRLLSVIYDHFLDKVATARDLEKASIQAMADSLLVIMPQDACQAKLVSQVGYFDDAESLIKTRLSLAEEAAINYVSFDRYASCIKPSESSANQIAVLVVSGPIVDGVGAPGTIGSKELASSLRAIRKDKSVKAVVLRINSPGGSALAADVLWRELILTKAQKPVVASMSDLAASGGYYLAAACDRILAHSTTITGSIGIFGLFFDVHALLNNKLGITTDVVKTGVSADLFENPGRSFNDHEKEIIQKVVNKGYNTFLERVAEGRSMKKEVIARVAGGRVWTGQNAQEQGLIDELGGLEAAVQAAAKLSGIVDDFTISYWPKPRALSEQVLIGWRNSVGNETARTLQKTFPALKHMQELVHMTSIQARLPYRIEIE
jgi:protease IV